MHADLTLKVVTPAFLGSHKPECVEVRTAPIRGALRYWLRALVGGAIGTHDIRPLRTVEESVFGSTRGNSPVTVRLTSASSLKQEKSYLLPHKVRVNPREAGERQAFTGGTITVRLAAKPLADVTALELALWAALVWTALGGLGCRSRRGAGSLRLQSADISGAHGLSQALVDALTAATTRQPDGEALAGLVYTVASGAHQAVLRHPSMSAATQSDPCPAFPVLPARPAIRVWCPAATTPIEAEKTLMKTMSDTKASLGGAEFAAAFGGISPRHASPLHVSVHETEAGAALIMTYLMGPNATVTQLFGKLTPSYPLGPVGGRMP